VTLEAPLVLQALPGDSPPTYSAAQFRALMDAVSPFNGVTHWGDLLVTQRGAGANFSVDIAPGTFTVTGSSVAYQGTYLARSTAVFNLPITGSGALTAGQSRVDLIVAQVYDSQADGLGGYSWTPLAITGVASSGAPAVPTTPANAYPLATVAVAYAQASVLNANLFSLRMLNTMGDRPQWSLTGGNGQAVPSGSATPYTAFTASNYIGVGTNGNPGEIVIYTPGKYAVSWTHRIDQGGTDTAYRACYMEQVRGGSVIRRIGPSEAFPGAVSATIGFAQTSTGQVRALNADVIRARSYHLCGTTNHLSDINLELSFTGTYLGP
jgi:hypothetical protein